MSKPPPAEPVLVPAPAPGGAGVAWRQSLGAGLLLGLAIGCGWLAHSTPASFAQLLLAVGALLLAMFGIGLMLPVADGSSWRGRWERRVEFQFTAAGIVFFTGLIILALAAFRSGNNLIYLVVAALLSALLVSGLTSALNLSGMTLRFRLPDEIFAGQPTPVAFTLNNEKSFWPAYSLTVAAASRPLASADAAAAEMHSVYFAYLPRRGSVRVDSEIVFPVRGRYTSAAFRLSTRFPFGLVNKRRRFQAGNREPETLVFPQPLPADEVRAFTPLLGAYREQYERGAGQELYRLRPHQRGDSARSVHWKISARVGELRVREFSQEGAQRLRLRFDLAPSPPAAAEAVISLCAGIVLALSETDVWIEFLGLHPETGAGAETGGLWLPLAPAAQHRRRILEYLALVDPSRRGDLIPPADEIDDELHEVLIAHPPPAAVASAPALARARD